MKDSVVGLVEKELVWFKEILKTNPLLFPEQDSLYPIPFFGDIRRAEILTLALNPAWTEFRKGGSKERHWISGLDTCALTTRLLHYFERSVPPHRWFGDRRRALDILGCSYETNAAHIDLHPHPTKFRKDLQEPQHKAAGRLIESHTESHLADLLGLASRAKLLLVVDYSFSKPDGTTTKTFDFISTSRPIWDLLHRGGNQLQVFSAGGPNDFEERVAENAVNLCKHLGRPPNL